MSTKELSGGARIHYIFQSIFVKSLEVHNLFSEAYSIFFSAASFLYLILIL